ncbi:Exodeoxyribonuclease I subunit D [Syntrophus gentianae]|uniref:Nuclease SbcCD subunit D n=1 Tax=Syntrophus gentianae TaxID=43775 RepID=A0A1H8BCR4_9BACT|nr:exonuclease SbcCD subunit D C-terminal domain-containing protein [Syntrophus gentianae]SEM80546.1 Exodeoxyribonuclease I subunit D [Syntrophus gentianae]
MKLLHTSDWHLGRTFDRRKRYDEYEAFLNWLVELIETQDVDVLLVAGDVFDSSTPSNRAQELYYRFLYRVAVSPRRHVVITGGNHDSPSFLNAPRELLRFLNIHVVGYASASPDEEVIVIDGQDGEPGLIVCAIPYLRDRDIRTAEAGESIEEKEQKMIEGIRTHYREVYDAARQKQALLNKPVSIVATGHLYTKGGKTVDGDGVRELYIGSLLHVGRDVFPDSIDYLALGHLHIPQSVGGSDIIRYSGSPLPIGFGEAAQEKSVVLVDFSGGTPTVNPIPVPCFQELRTLRGDWPVLARDLEVLKSRGSRAWIEILYEGEEAASDLQKRLDEAVQGSGMEILRVKNKRMMERAMSGHADQETLDDLIVTDVFERCLDDRNVSTERRPALLSAFREIIVSLDEQDPRAE